MIQDWEGTEFEACRTACHSRSGLEFPPKILNDNGTGGGREGWRGSFLDAWSFVPFLGVVSKSKAPYAKI